MKSIQYKLSSFITDKLRMEKIIALQPLSAPLSEFDKDGT